MNLPIVDDPFSKPTKKQLKNAQKWIDKPIPKRKSECKNIPITVFKTKIYDTNTNT